MEYQAYVLPKKRDRFFQHFLSSTAEDNYLKAYTALSGDINVTGSFFDMGMREIALPYDNISIAVNFYLVNFLRIKENGYYYYYNVTGVIKQTPKLIRYSIELDEYHTFFNNRGRDYNFKGYLKFSNTRCIADEAKKFLNPSSSIADFTYKALPFRYKTGQNLALVPILVFKGSISGIHVVTTASDYYSFDTPYRDLLEIAKAGKLNYTYHFYNAESNTTTIVTKEETIEIIATYIIPFYFVGSRFSTADYDYWTASIPQALSAPQSLNLYEFLSERKVSQDFDVSNYRNKIVEFGTFSSRLNLGVDGKILTINAQLSVLSDNIDISLWCGTQRLSITKDFECVVSSSALNQYLNSNAITLALKTIAAAGKTVGGIVTGNIGASVSGISSGVSIISDIYQQEQTSGNTYGTSGAELNYKFFGTGILDPFYLWVFSPKNENFLFETKLVYGGDCQNLPISFELMKSTDKTNPTAAYNYYEFTKIVSDYPQANRIAPLLLGGIEMEFIE